MLGKFAIALMLACLITQPTLAAGCYTNYVVNGSFNSSTNWTYSNGAYRETTLDDPCDIYFGYTMKAAALTVPTAKVSQVFTTNPGSPLGWTMNFEIQTQSLAGATPWDELRILVEDLTTGQAEVFFVKAPQLTSTCQRFDFTLSNNYAGHQVRLSFNAQAFTQFDMYIDNVAFFERSC